MEKIISEDVRICAEYIKKDAKKLDGKTLLVTGAAGFLGSYYVDVVAYLNENFLEKPCRIIAVDNFVTGKDSKIAHLKGKPHFSMIKADVTKPFETDEEISFIIHAASIASPTFYRKYPIETIDANVYGTRNMLELAKKKKVESFVFMSSSEVYGDIPADKLPVKEDYWGNVSFTGPRACYDEAKRLGETLCANFFRVYSVPVKCVRPFNVYGPRLSLDDRRVLPDFLRDALSNKDIILLSDGTPTRSFCYVSDFMRGFFEVLLSDFNGEAFNIGNEKEEISMKELAEKVLKAAGSSKKVVLGKSEDANYTKDNPQRRCPDTSKMKKLFGWEANVMLEDGLKRTVAWHKAQK